VLRKSKRRMTYHGRGGYPVIHKTNKGRMYIMVRKRGGGVKRLYLSEKAKRRLYSKEGY